ncbi:MAG: hypothetical protein BAA01_09540 [Bacillus thermozeamaize]|uniref:Viral late gene transcription factor 3 zinc ribbon domain-containing protein n=1 Tax=Bacillus thermozeamaize TaxID=230954 RepID=A0A1Y3PEC9_9BACI|nr:MAG: hypothetical protein BAA01_09540 [Bacillus thermozeamaize]
MNHEYLLKYVCDDCDGQFIVNSKDADEHLICPFCQSEYVYVTVKCDREYVHDEMGCLFPIARA